MNGFGMIAALLLAWPMCCPEHFGRHLAEIADAFEQKRAKLRAEREPAP